MLTGPLDPHLVFFCRSDLQFSRCLTADQYYFSALESLDFSKSKACADDISNVLLLFTTQSRLSMTQRKEAFENILGIRENAGNQQFLLFPQCFLPFPKQVLIFHAHFFCHLQVLLIWTGLKLYR